MKKILTIILACACAIALFSCGESGTTVSDFKKAINNTNPTEIQVTIVQETVNGDLNAEMTTTFAEDGSFAIVGSYEIFTSATSSVDKETVEINVTCSASGSYSDGGAFAGSNPASTGAKLNLGAKKLDYTISSDGKVLTANVAAANTKAVLGVEYASDVVLVVTIDNGVVISYTMNYTNEFGAVSVVCSYR